MRSITDNSREVVLPRITLPPFEPPTPAELARRREVAERARALREEIGPIGISILDIIREVRDELDGIEEVVT